VPVWDSTGRYRVVSRILHWEMTVLSLVVGREPCALAAGGFSCKCREVSYL